MSRLYIKNALLSDKVRTSHLSYEGDNIVTHKLLSGKKVIQHIGELSEFIEVSCVINETNKELLDKGFSEIAEITLKRYDDYFYGYIDDYPNFEIFRDSLIKDKRLYIAKFTLNIDGDDY